MTVLQWELINLYIMFALWRSLVCFLLMFGADYQPLAHISGNFEQGHPFIISIGIEIDRTLITILAHRLQGQNVVSHSLISDLHFIFLLKALI
jgi:hypothetical protein